MGLLGSDLGQLGSQLGNPSVSNRYSRPVVPGQDGSQESKGSFVRSLEVCPRNPHSSTSAVFYGLKILQDHPQLGGGRDRDVSS